MAVTRWGIIGPGGIAHNYADGLKECASGELVAIASRNDARRKTFGDDYNIAENKRYNSYEAMAADPEIDAIYISTPHPWHAELSIMAMRAGKAVLVEKPGGMNAKEITTMIEVAAQQQVFFMEAFMYRCHPQIARVLEIIAAGEIGDIYHIRTPFGFNAGFDPNSRLYNFELAGGGILDVGGYPVSLARLIAGAAIGQPFDNPNVVKGMGLMAKTGVDEVAYALLKFPSGFTAEVSCAVARNMDNRATIHGSKGQIVIDDAWVPGRNAGPSDATLHITVDGDTREEVLRDPRMLFAFEAEVASKAIADGKLQADAPAMSHADSIGNNTVLDRWRNELGYVTMAEKPATNHRIDRVLPSDLPAMKTRKIDGVKTPVSQLIMGCDNQATFSEGAIIWDAWMDAGGNAFDTANHYANGLQEKLLGQWLKSRGVAGDVVVIGKGGHTPNCNPQALTYQLEETQDRLGLEHLPIYIMHRDNPDVPVGEFVDLLNRFHADGKIGIFGGSNWSVDRMRAANAYAAANGLKPMRVLNNNLSLAVMTKPVWDGCVTSHTDDMLGFLRETNTIHMSWSSQARGYFLPQELRDRLPLDTRPETCFGGDDNAERRKRAEQLADKYDVSANSIATAWVLGQTFPSFALIGPRSPGELATSLEGLKPSLSAEELDWLDLGRSDI